jgi:hypothetical protein
MNDVLYAEKLAWFKERERPEAALAVADDTEYIMIVLAWTGTNVKCADSITEPLDDSEHEAWDWLWENAEYSPAELIDRIGIPLSLAGLEKKMRFLIGNRVIYPDGTANSYVERYLREQVLKLFDAKSQRPVKRS